MTRGILGLLALCAITAPASHRPPAAVGSTIGASHDSAWKTFRSKGGWQIQYPPTWRRWSCMSCSDPTAADVYVTFGRPASAGRTVMVEPLAPRRDQETQREWVQGAEHTANQNPIVDQDSIDVNGLPAFRVRYRHPAGEMECFYLVDGSRMFAISTDILNPEFYATYRRMVSTFRVTVRGRPPNQRLEPAGRRGRSAID